MIQLVVDNSAMGVLRAAAGQKPTRAIVLMEDGDGNLQARWSTMDRDAAIRFAKECMQLFVTGLG